MQSLKVKFVIDVVLCVLTSLTFLVAVSDLNGAGNNILALRGCLLFVVPFMSEGLAYYVTLGGVHMDRFVFNTVVYVIEFASVICVAVLMLLKSDLADAEKNMIAILMTIYPFRKTATVFYDICALWKLYKN